VNQRPVLRFGEIARRLGFVTEADLEDALKLQRRRLEEGKEHRLLGLILLELGLIDNGQLIEILRVYQQNGARETAAS
jgi:hypothetical protein